MRRSCLMMIVRIAAVAVTLSFSVFPAYAQQQPDTNCFLREECLGEKPENVQGDCTPEKCFVKDDPKCPSDAGSCYAKSKPVALTVAIGTKSYALDLADYIAVIYNYGAGIAGVIAAVMMMIGGLQYLTAGGDAQRVKAAQGRITNAVVGLALALGAYTLLNTVNPDILSLRLPKIKLIKRRPFVDCQLSEKCKPCGAQYGLIKKPSETNEVTFKTKQENCDQTVINDKTNLPYTVAVCTGKGCARSGIGGTTDSGCTSTDVTCRIVKTPKEGPDCGKTVPPPIGGSQYICKVCKSAGKTCTGSDDDSCCSGKCAANDDLLGKKLKPFFCAGQKDELCFSDAHCGKGLICRKSSIAAGAVETIKTGSAWEGSKETFVAFFKTGGGSGYCDSGL